MLEEVAWHAYKESPFNRVTRAIYMRVNRACIWKTIPALSLPSQAWDYVTGKEISEFDSLPTTNFF
jgi:hypothetical protein